MFFFAAGDLERGAVELEDLERAEISSKSSSVSLQDLLLIFVDELLLWNVCCLLACAENISPATSSVSSSCWGVKEQCMGPLSNLATPSESWERDKEFNCVGCTCKFCLSHCL